MQITLTDYNAILNGALELKGVKQTPEDKLFSAIFQDDKAAAVTREVHKELRLAGYTEVVSDQPGYEGRVSFRL